ncbi:MAG: hypothetical protein IJ906_01880, partial [Oscillospiraceae bacterium]|nr:hypothetical protein [Oscillospiraceae bacterium]
MNITLKGAFSSAEALFLLSEGVYKKVFIVLLYQIRWQDRSFKEIVTDLFVRGPGSIRYKRSGRY